MQLFDLDKPVMVDGVEVTALDANQSVTLHVLLLQAICVEKI